MTSDHDHEWDDDDGVDEGPSDADLARFGDETVTCRRCGHEYYDQLDDCPRCGSGSLGPRRWPVVVLLVVAAAVAGAIAFGLM